MRFSDPHWERERQGDAALRDVRIMSKFLALEAKDSGCI